MTTRTSSAPDTSVSDAFEAGRDAYLNEDSNNPFKEHSEEWKSWWRGHSYEENIKELFGKF